MKVGALRLLTRSARLASLAVACGASLSIAGCQGSAIQPAPSAASATAIPSGVDPLPSLGSTATNGGGDPRSSAYWIQWSSCGEGSQAAVARQNGGREAGWILVDDLITDPGLALGDHDVTTCGEAAAILDGSTRGLLPGAIGELPRQVLTAELNLSSGAESCEAAETSVLLGQAILSALGFDGHAPLRAPDAQEETIVADAVQALREYNSGALCR